MAKIADTSGSSNIWLGSKQNTRQTILYVPASNVAGSDTADKPGLLFLEAVDSSGTIDTGLYLWADSDGALRYSGTYPTNENSSGSTIAGDTDVKVATDAAATAGYLGVAYGDGVLRTTQNEIDVVDGGDFITLGLADHNTARTALGLAIGSDVQAYDAGLTDLAAVAMVADRYYYTSGDNTHVAAAITAGGRAIVAAANDAAVLALLSGDAGATFAWNSQSLSGVNDLGAVTGTFSGAISTTSAVVNSDITIGTGSIVSASGAISFGDENLTTQGDIHIDLDDGELQLGNETSDSSIKFDGTNLIFYDTNAGAYTLNELAASGGTNPIIAGDLLLTDGSITLTDSDSAVSLSVTNDTMSTSGTNMVKFDASALTTQCVLTVDATALSTGEFISCDDGGVQQLAIKRYGEVEILGTDAADMITITKGHIVLSDGTITTSADSNIGSKVARNFTGSNSALLELETTHTGDAGDALLIDSKRTVGPACAINIDSTATTQTAGVIDMDLGITTGVGIHMTADALTSGSLAHFYTDSSDTTARNLVTITSDNTANTIEQALFIDQDGATSAQAIVIDSEALTPTAGVIDLDLAITTGTALDINLGTAVTSGSGIVILDNSADTTARNVVSITVDNAAAIGAKCLVLNQDSTEEALFIDHDDDIGAATPVLANPGSLCIDADGNDGTNAVCGMFVSSDNAGAGDAYGIYINDITASGTAYALVTKGTGKVQFNVDADDADFQVSSDNMSHALFVDAGNDLIQINSSAVTGALLNVTVDNTDSVNGLYVDQNDTTNNKDGVVIETAGTGYGLKMTTGSTTGKGAYFLACASQTTSNVVLDGVTNDWSGADDVGMLHIKSDATLADVGASLLYLTTSSIKGAAEGGLARLVVTGTPQTDAYAMEIEVPATQPAFFTNGGVVITGQTAHNAALVQITGNDASNDVVALDIHNEGTAAALQITGDDTDSLQLKVVSKASQTTSAVAIDGETTDWIGNADDVGMVQITHGTTALAHTGSTLLRVSSSATQKASAEGTLARFEVTGAAQANAVAVEILAKDATEYALNVGAGLVKVTEHVHAKGFEYNVVTRTANNAGDGSAIVAAGEQFLQVDTTTADNADILTLPAGLAGMIVYIYNSDGAWDFVIDGNGGETINGGANVTLGENDLAILRCVADGVWVCSEIAANGALTTGA